MLPCSTDGAQDVKRKKKAPYRIYGMLKKEIWNMLGISEVTLRTIRPRYSPSFKWRRDIVKTAPIKVKASTIKV